MQFRDLDVGPAPQLPLSVYKARRNALAEKLGPGNVAVICTHSVKVYANDVDYLFRPHSDFWYLTGFSEPNAVLVLRGGSGTTTMFLQEREPQWEIWNGRRLGVARAKNALGVDAAYDYDQLLHRLPGVIGKAKVHLLPGDDALAARRVKRAAGDRLLPTPTPGRPGGPKKKKSAAPPGKHAMHYVHEMRLIKSDDEIKMLRKACDLGVEGHFHTHAGIKPGAKEYQIEADFIHHCRHKGSQGVGYPSICGCGDNAAVLHYNTNRGPMKRGDLFLIDAGCEWGWYTSDITRTYPVGGEWTGRQVEIYEVVLKAQQEAMKEVKPGNLFVNMHRTAVEHIADGLVDLGLLRMSKEKAIEEEHYRRFFMHGTGHWLGLDVHDAGTMTEPDGSPRVFKQGMVCTTEPGLYFNKDFTSCPTGTQGIGIRIEDDVLVGARGPVNLTRKLPVDPSEVADLVRRG